MQSSSSRMRVIYHNWSAMKQRPHPQSVAEISHHLCSVLHKWSLFVVLVLAYPVLTLKTGGKQLLLYCKVKCKLCQMGES